jgi:hypothetical protein
MVSVSCVVDHCAAGAGLARRTQGLSWIRCARLRRHERQRIASKPDRDSRHALIQDAARTTRDPWGGQLQGYFALSKKKVFYASSKDASACDLDFLSPFSKKITIDGFVSNQLGCKGDWQGPTVGEDVLFDEAWRVRAIPRFGDAFRRLQSGLHLLQ